MKIGLKRKREKIRIGPQIVEENECRRIEQSRERERDRACVCVREREGDSEQE